MDPLQPSPSEEELLKAIQISALKQPKVENEQQASTEEETEPSNKWKKAKEKTVGPNSDYVFMKSFTRLFSQLNPNQFGDVSPTI